MPSLELEMMVQRRSPKDAVGLRVVLPVSALAVLEDASLQNHGRCFRHENATNDEQQELGLEQDGHRTQRATECERASVAHEDVGGMRVVPEKAHARPEDSGAEDRELSRVAEVEDVEVGTGIHPTHDVREHGERRGRNGGEPGGKYI